MRAFAFSLIARDPDGITRPLTGEISAPVAVNDGSDEYLCNFICPLTRGGGQFRSRYPEWVYSKAISFVRFDMQGQGFEIRDTEGKEADIMPPVTDAFGIPCFAPARFQGRCLHNGALTDFTAEVQPPEPHRLGWGCPVEISHYGRCGPILSSWPEHAYELAFAFLRRMLDYHGQGSLTDMTGAPLLIRAPTWFGLERTATNANEPKRS